MKINGWAVMQAVQHAKTRDFGIKLLEFAGMNLNSLAVFPTKDDARLYLSNMIEQVKFGQEMGLRSKGNLDPKAVGGMDFLIVPITSEVDDQLLLKRGWIQ